MTTTKLGYHVATGSRNGYGLAAAAGPALVVAVGTAGAFDELPAETRKVYRDISLWANVPHGYQTLTPEQIRGNVMAAWGPALELIYQPIRERYANVWFQPTNEMAGNTPHEHAANAALEQAFVDYFTPRGYRLCLFNFSGGDPSIEDWQEHYWPVLAYAADLDAGHAYGRHVYGGVPAGAHNMLTQGGQAHSDNTRRPFVEADALWAAGIRIPVFLTEAGQNGGYLFPGVPAFMEDARAFDLLCGQHANIAGFAAWTYGDYQGRPANIEPASAALASYLGERSIAPIELPEEPEPIPWHKAIVVKAPQEVTAEQWAMIADYAYDFRHTFTASHDDTVTVLDAGRPDSYAKIVYPSLPSQQQTIAAIEAIGRQWVDVTGDVFPDDGPEMMYDVPFVSQIGSGALLRNDCGPACVSMVTRYYNRQFSKTVDQISADMGKTGSENTSIAQNMQALARYGVSSFFERYGPDPWEELTGDLDQHGPIIALVYYAYMPPGSWAPAAGDGRFWHFLVVTGYNESEGMLYVNDPLDVNRQHKPIPWAGFVGAWQGNGGNLPNQAIVASGYDAPDPEPPPPPPPPPAGQLVDVAAYMFPAGVTQYMMRAADGSQERYRNWVMPDGRRAIQKNRWAEIYGVDPSFVSLDIDLTPDDERFYVRTAGSTTQYYAPYVPRFMRVGEQWSDNGHYVQFYNKADCSPSNLNSGNVTQYARLLAKHNTFTTPHGRACGETIVLETSIKADFSESETHWFAKGPNGEGLGRVGWRSAWGEAWATAEDVSGQQPEPLELPACWQG